MKNFLIASTVVVLLAGMLPGSVNAQLLDFGDAPEGALAYPSSGIGGAFPTCMQVGPAGWIQHTNFGTWFGPATMVDFEPDGNAGMCPPGGFPPYDQDECFADPDAGLLIPPAYTIDPTPAVVPCMPGVEGPLGTICQTANWGVNVDIDVHNWMPGHPEYLPGFVNVLMDWNQDGDWNDVTDCYTQGDAPEHVLVDFMVPPQYDGPLSALMPPGFLIGPNPGYVWTRFTISEVPVGFGWNGEGFFEDGETEDYLLLVEGGEPTVFPVIETECPEVDTYCPLIETECPVVATKCPVEDTECPVIETHCPVDPTYCPVVETQCPAAGPTICPEIATECPEIVTECPYEFTTCPEYYTYCPEEMTFCPVWPTECPMEPTFCPMDITVCEFTMCEPFPTWCPEEPTLCPVTPTVCPTIPTVCPITPVSTVCPEIATECPATVTECQIIPTECPDDPTYCTTADTDGDGINDCLDNCIYTPNGYLLGTCAYAIGPLYKGTGTTCTSSGDCGSGEVCQMSQEDCNSNGAGDVCECYADFDGDGNVYPSDLSVFLGEYGRTDCLTTPPPCQADFDNDGNVYPSDLSLFLQEYGRTDCPPTI